VNIISSLHNTDFFLNILLDGWCWWPIAILNGQPDRKLSQLVITFTILNGLNYHEDARILVVGDAGAALLPTRSYTPLQLSFIIVFI
jgi:hypothetical protein